MVTIDNIMKTFREYVDRRDETSSNILQNIGGGKGRVVDDAKDLVGTMGFPIAGAIAAPYAAAKGFLGTTPGKFRSMVHGNPYISDTPQKTYSLAKVAFDKSSSWLLDHVDQEKVPQAKDRLRASLQQAIQELENHWQQAEAAFNSQQRQQPTKITATGGMVGQQATGLSNFFAAPAALIAGITQAAKNVIDTLNPAYQNQSYEWVDSVNKMILSLDALNSWEKSAGSESQEVDTLINEFLHHLQYGGGSKARKIGRS